MTWVSSWPPSRCFKYFRWPRVIVPQSAGLGGRTPAAVPAAASAAAPGPSPAAPPAAVAAASAPALPIYQYFDPSTAVSAAARQSLCATGATAPCCAVAATSVGSCSLQTARCAFHLSIIRHPARHPSYCSWFFRLNVLSFPNLPSFHSSLLPFRGLFSPLPSPDDFRPPPLLFSCLSFLNSQV